MEQIYSGLDATQQALANKDYDDAPMDEESSQGTAKDENVKIEGSDFLQEAPEKEYHYHNYVLTEEYTRWICDIGFPDTDSDDEGADIPMYDDYLDDANECSSSSGRSLNPQEISSIS